MEATGSNKDIQLKIVYGTVIAVAVYFLCTSVLPWLYHRLQLEMEKRTVISTLQKDIPSVDAVVSELRDYKSKKTLPETVETKRAPRNPTYALPRQSATGIGGSASTPVQSQQKGSPVEATIDTRRRAAPTFQLSSSQSSATGERSRATAPSPDTSSASTRRAAPASGGIAGGDTTRAFGSSDLSTFAEDSIEARLHSSARSGHQEHMIAYRPEQLQQLNAARALDRSLLEQQNAEFRASEERDRQRLEEERKKQEHTALVEARRTFLAGAIKPEPAATGGEGGDSVTLQFRFRDAASSSQAAGAGSAKAARIKRRFSRTDATAEDLLLYVESLELRPLLSGEVELCLDYPTRMLSRETDCSKTLAELGINADSVVWVSFKGD